LILHAHWSNRGDEAAIRAMIDSLRARLPVDKMWIMIVAPDPPEWFPYEDIEILEYYPKLWVLLNRPLDLLDFVDATVNIVTMGRLSCTKRGRDFLRAAEEADVVIHAPGGPTIGDLNSAGDLQYLHRLFVAKVFKRKPLFFYAPSMGPFSGRLRNALRRFILRRADALILREEISYGYLKSQLGLEAEVTLDSAFQNDVPEDYLNRYAGIADMLTVMQQNRTIGLVVTDLKWHSAYRSSEEMATRIMASSIDVTKYLLDKGYSILLIPQLFGSYGVTYELHLLEKIRSLDKERIRLLMPDVDAFGQQIVISKLFSLISMRYHPVVFAAKANIPFISIYYEHKTEGFVRRIGLEDFAVSVEQLTPQEIITRFNRLEQNHQEIRERLMVMNPLLKQESRRTTGMIAAKLKEYGWSIGK